MSAIFLTVFNAIGGWKVMAVVGSLLGAWFIGWRGAKKAEKKKELEARIELHKRLSTAKDNIIDIEREKNKVMREIHEKANEKGSAGLRDFANELLGKIFKPKR
jgi:hypothetical protein